MVGVDDSADGLRLFSYDEAHQLTSVRSAAGVICTGFKSDNYTNTKRAYGQVFSSGAGVGVLCCWWDF